MKEILTTSVFILLPFFLAGQGLNKKAVSDLLATQMPSGYIGNYSDSAQLQQWDIWGRKYTMLGLLAYYDLCGETDGLRDGEI